MQRKRQYEPRKSCHDGAGQCDGGSGNSRRVATIDRSRHHSAGQRDGRSGNSRRFAANGVLTALRCHILFLEAPGVERIGLFKQSRAKNGNGSTADKRDRR